MTAVELLRITDEHVDMRLAADRRTWWADCRHCRWFQSGRSRRLLDVACDLHLLTEHGIETP